MQIPRPDSSALLLILTLLATSTAARPQGPEILPSVDLSEADPAVRAQIEHSRNAVERLLARGAPDEPRAQGWGRLGRIYHAYGYDDAARRCYERASRLAPERPSWWYLQGVTAEQDGDLEAAEHAFRRALELAPDEPGIALRLGEIHLASSRSDEAIQLLETAARHEAYRAVAELALGRAHLARGAPDRAVESFRTVLELQPEATIVYGPLAQALRRADRVEEAREALGHRGTGEVRRPDPWLDEVYRLRRGVSHLLMAAGNAAAGQRYEEAEQLYRLALERRPDRVEAKKGLAGLLMAQPDSSEDGLEAMALLREALAEVPDDVDARLRLAHLLERNGRASSALDEYRRAVEIAPGLTEPRLALAAALHRAGKPDRAISAYDAVLATSPEDRRAVIGRIQALAATGDLAAARSAADRRLRQWPDDHALRLLAGQLAAQAGARAEATDTLRDLVDRPGVDPRLAARAAHSLGNLAAQRRQWDDALRHYEEALALDPELAVARLALDAVRRELDGASSTRSTRPDEG